MSTSSSQQSSSSKDSSVEPLSQQSQDSAPPFDYVSPKKRSTNTTDNLNQWVCLIPDNVLKKPTTSDCNTANSLSLVSLPDPSTGDSRNYILGPTGDEIFEVQKFSDGPRSWFIGDSLYPDGTLYMCTQVDPLFIVLPFLLKSNKVDKFTTSDGLLDSETCPYWSLLDHLVPPLQWECICETKKLSNGVLVYRYCPKRTLNWLTQKVSALAEGLKDEKVHVGCGVQSSSFVRSKKLTAVTQDEYTSYACGIVCDYLPPSLAATLASRYHSPEKRKHVSDEDTSNQPPTKKSAMEENNAEPFENYYTASSETSKQVQNKTRLTTAQKALAKVNKRGMKPLTNFFGKS